MPHVAFVPLAGFRVREEAMRELGMTLPGLRQRARAIGELPSLGLLTLAGMTPEPWTCSYHEAGGVEGALVDLLARERPDLVAISALTASAEEAYRLGDALRAAGLRAVFGGLHATTCPDEAQAHFDAVVAGEGESVWAHVLADALAGSLRPLYRGGPYELARSPVPRFDLLRGARPRMTIQTQRGCPLSCEFCGASRLLGPFREKPVANLRREIGAMGRVPLVELADDNTFAGPRETGPLLDVLAQSGARWFTEADWRIGERPEVLERLAGSGCAQVLVGIESQVYRHAGMGAKRTEWPRMRDAIARIQDSGVAVNGCFIVGCDGEDRTSLDRLRDLILASPLADVQITLQTPFPGTALHRRLCDAGRLLPGRGWSHYTLFDLTYRPDPMGVEDLERAFRDLVRDVFSATAAARRSRIRREAWRRARHARVAPTCAMDPEADPWPR